MIHWKIKKNNNRKIIQVSILCFIKHPALPWPSLWHLSCNYYGWRLSYFQHLTPRNKRYVSAILLRWKYCFAWATLSFELFYNNGSKSSYLWPHYTGQLKITFFETRSKFTHVLERNDVINTMSPSYFP